MKDSHRTPRLASQEDRLPSDILAAYQHRAPWENLTTWEWSALNGGLDLAGGYARQLQSQAQLQIVDRLPFIYLRAERERPEDLQREFTSVFFDLAGQHAYAHLNPPLYHYSATLAAEAVANYLRLSRKAVGLLHPCVDTIPALLRRHEIPLRAIEEPDLAHPLGLNVDNLGAIFLICPNNPTGFELTSERFQDVVTACRRRGLMLIVDFSFRFFSSYTGWDQYALLADSGIDFVAIEDTGKTWPTLGLKLGALISNRGIYTPLQKISDDFRLNISPFVFALLAEYLSLERATSLDISARQIVEQNRCFLRAAIAGTPLTLLSRDSQIGLELLQLPDGWRADEFCVWLVKHCQLYALPTSHFYWNDPNRVSDVVRIALLRSPAGFREAATKLSGACLEYAQHVAAGHAD